MKIAEQSAWCQEQGVRGAPATLYGDDTYGGARPLEFYEALIAGESE